MVPGCWSTVLSQREQFSLTGKIDDGNITKSPFYSRRKPGDIIKKARSVRFPPNLMPKLLDVGQILPRRLCWMDAHIHSPHSPPLHNQSYYSPLVFWKRCLHVRVSSHTRTTRTYTRSHWWSPIVWFLPLPPCWRSDRPWSPLLGLLFRAKRGSRRQGQAGLEWKQKQFTERRK